MKTVIEIKNLSKMYRLGEIGTGTISRDLERWYWTKIKKQTDPFLKVGEENGQDKRSISNIVYSLRDINLQIKQGEALGIIGKNGAGKSTLLKVLSRVTSPTTGSIRIKGRIASLLEVGTGFHPELTGRENIYLNGAILGMRNKEIKQKLDEIIDFSGIERYIDTPVKRYSSGMYVRLAFAVAAHLESEILVLDEVLAVGDSEFQKKCLGKIGEVSKGDGRTILFVSHNMQAISTLTNTALFLHQGEIKEIGKTREVIGRYLTYGVKNELLYLDDGKDEKPKITRVELKTSETGNTHIHGDKFEILIEAYLPNPLKGGALSIQFFNSMETPVLHVWIFDKERKIFRSKGIHKLKCTIPRFRMYMGKYTTTIYLASEDGQIQHQMITNICPFEVIMLNTKRTLGWREGETIFLEEFEWTIS